MVNGISSEKYTEEQIDWMRNHVELVLRFRKLFMSKKLPPDKAEKSAIEIKEEIAEIMGKIDVSEELGSSIGLHQDFIINFNNAIREAADTGKSSEEICEKLIS
jgi:hypothetical protein